MKIGITGSGGLLGFHMRALLHTSSRYEALLADRAVFSSDVALDAVVRDAEAIIHFAGVNRGAEAEVETGNAAVAERLVAAMERCGATPVVVYANSIHCERDTPYGCGKRRAAEIFEAWAARSGARFVNAVLPHVFGEFGKPFYNSVVSTFCHQLAAAQGPRIDNDSQLELAHAQDVARFCLAAIEDGASGAVRLAGEPITVSALLEKLEGQKRQYDGKLMPSLEEPLDLRLFNTLRSYLYPQYYPVRLDMRSDNRGSLFEAIKSEHGGQVFLSSTVPGATRGNHFHTRKIERFLVVAGEAEIRLRKLFTDAVDTFRVSGAQPCFIDMPTFHTHSIQNVGNSEVITLFWANEIYDPNDSDTYSEQVLM
jgi:UDP-2-acetamido-2,6-beta-L-arabino-hexul-4-ose reductase